MRAISRLLCLATLIRRPIFRHMALFSMKMLAEKRGEL